MQMINNEKKMQRPQFAVTSATTKKGKQQQFTSQVNPAANPLTSKQ
jgi:hypothetical protein